VLYDFRNDPDKPTVYDAPVGMGDDPSILGSKFISSKRDLQAAWDGRARL
jgi:hypothetical protein